MFSNDLICNILIYINDNIKSKISIEDLEKKFFYNRYYIMKLFKKEIGLTIIEYINSIRIYNSIQQIKETNNSLTNISIKCGFYSLEYFSETFKQITNLNPQKFRNYFSNKRGISFRDIDLINDAVVKLFEISIIKNNYLARKKKNYNYTKKLSIFK